MSKPIQAVVSSFALAGRYGATLTLAALLALAGCATRYTYSFRLTEPCAGPALEPGSAEVVEDADVKVAILVDAAAGAVHLDVTNKTDEVLQVEWGEISIAGPEGRVTTLRPDADVGWIQPGTIVAARLYPIALPRSGREAARNEGKRFELSVPMIVRREPKLYRYSLTAHVRAL